MLVVHAPFSAVARVTLLTACEQRKRYGIQPTGQVPLSSWRYFGPTSQRKNMRSADGKVRSASASFWFASDNFCNVLHALESEALAVQMVTGSIVEHP